MLHVWQAHGVPGLCVLCLGHTHAEDVLRGYDCRSSEDLPIKILCMRLSVVLNLCLPRGQKSATLHSKPHRATAHIVEKVYITAGHAASALFPDEAPEVPGQGGP